ncbi:MAG TPA: calcium-binding protein [Bauldia sp.]|nr:calcium-binding protein [Bauldia sp.]
MYSHLASNDSTGPLDFADPGGWFRAATVAPFAGSYSRYGKDGADPWIEIETDAGPFRLTGVAWTLHDGSPPPSNATTIHLAVSSKQYISVAANSLVDRVFSHTHQTSFDNVYGNGTRPTIAEVLGKHPIDLLSLFATQRIDGSKLGDTIVLNDMGSIAYSNNGKDNVTGGAGDDLAFGGKGKDYLFGAGGQDELHGDNANDRLFGGADNDKLFGGAHKDTAYGGDGQDAIYGEWQNDRLYGEGDNDTISGGDNNDRLYGGDGQDRLYGDNGQDGLYGEGDNDDLFGAEGNDRLYGGIGQDEAYGDTGNDRLFGDADSDSLYGGKGNDLIYGGVGQDAVFGDDGSDRLHGDADNDTLQGHGGNDRLFGGIGQDVLLGSFGKDRLNGEDDNDRLDGGFDKDVLAGGGGANAFVFSTPLGPNNVDRITDFKAGFDSIELSSAVFDALSPGPLPEAAFHRGGSAHDADDRIVYNPKNGALVYDQNGDKGGGERVFAKLSPDLPLSHTDLLVV